MEKLAAALEHFRRGDVRTAVTLCEIRLRADDSDAEAASLLAEIHQATGNAAAALPLLERVSQLRPRDAAAHRRRAGVLLEAGRAAEAERALRTAIELDPTSARAHNNLGQALIRLGRTAAAIDAYAAALAIDPDYTIASINQGKALEVSGELGRALAAYERALGGAHWQSEAWAGRASVLARQHRWVEALESCDHALSTAVAPPSVAEAHHIRANALRRLGRRSEALESLDCAVAAQPDHVDAWSNRGLVQHELGRFAAAVASFRKAVTLEPNAVQPRTRLLARLIPSVPASETDAARARGEFDAELAGLESWLGGRRLDLQDALTAAQQQFFYLSYQETSNRDLLERYRAAAVTRLAGFDLAAEPALAPFVGASDAGSPRIRVGFVSAHVHDHSVFNAILRGWLEHLDHSRFELFVFQVGTIRDPCTAAAAAAVDHIEYGPHPVLDWVRCIRGCRLDVLVYPEIGMNETTLALAALRLAPLQLASWGHPETSGLPTIDGFLSADCLEPPDAQAHYSERLLRLPNLGVHCRPYEVAPAPFDWDRHGVNGDGPILLCPGTPFKYQPRDDRILIEIAQRLGRCTFVFFRHDEMGELSQALEARIAGAFRAAKLDPARHLAWVPWLPRHEFFALLRAADVYLDTIGFSGFNTLLQAVECRLPCVGFEGRFLRGRLGSGTLRRLGMGELVATGPQHYVDLATRLATDAPYRSQIRTALDRAAPLAYRDQGAIDAFSRVLERRGAEST